MTKPLTPDQRAMLTSTKNGLGDHAQETELERLQRQRMGNSWQEVIRRAMRFARSLDESQFDVAFAVDDTCSARMVRVDGGICGKIDFLDNNGDLLRTILLHGCN